MKYEIIDKPLFLESIYNLQKAIGSVSCTPAQQMNIIWKEIEDYPESFSDLEAVRAYILSKDIQHNNPIHILFNEAGLWEEVVNYTKVRTENH